MLRNKVCFPALLPLTIFLVLVSEILGHGMMLDPVSRSSRWRYDKSAPINYDDNGLFCGGFNAQWFRNNGKCGLCGDSFDDPRPRANEIGGKYGQGVITKVYSPSQNAKLGIKITTNHLGFFYFNICNLDKFKEESEDCFSANKIKFADGSFKMYIGKKSGMIYPNIVFPKGLMCKHCVLRWNYQAGNNWGPCGNGTSALGCGPQENFKGCSDISITKKSPGTNNSKDEKKKFSKENPNRKDNLYEFVPKSKTPHFFQNLNNYFYQSAWKNCIDNIFSELKKEQQKVLDYEKKLNTKTKNIFREFVKEQDIVNVLRDFEENEEEVPIFIDDDQLYKAEDVADYNAFDFNEMQKGIPELTEADQSDKDIKPDFYDSGSEELIHNTIDNSFYDLEYV